MANSLKTDAKVCCCCEFS